MKKGQIENLVYIEALSKIVDGLEKENTELIKELEKVKKRQMQQKIISIVIFIVAILGVIR